MNESVLRNHSFPLVFCLWTSGALAVLKNESLKTLLLILKMVLFFQFSLWCGVKSRKYSKKQRSSPSFKRSAPRLHSDAWTGMRPCITTVSQRLWRWGNVVPLFEEAYCMTHVRNRAACALFLHSGSTLYTLVFFHDNSFHECFENLSYSWISKNVVFQNKHICSFQFPLCFCSVLYIFFSPMNQELGFPWRKINTLIVDKIRIFQNWKPENRIVLKCELLRLC